MIHIIRAPERTFRDMGWLQTHWLFSFGDYYDPENVRHGRLRVFNDDVVQPHGGFPTHPHEEMEIVSIILQGKMVHRDSMGNVITLEPGDVQRMTAGTGITHSEMNESVEPVGFFQIWIEPEKQNKGLKPSYDQMNFAPASYQDRLKLLAAPFEDRSTEPVVRLNTDGKIFRTRYRGGFSETYATSAERMVFVYVIEGEVRLNNLLLGARDQARIREESRIRLEGDTEVDLILIDVSRKDNP